MLFLVILCVVQQCPDCGELAIIELAPGPAGLNVFFRWVFHWLSR